MLFILKAVISALIILFVTWIAEKLPAIGGWIAALPLVSLLSALWLYAGQQTHEEIAHFLTGVLWGLIPTALLLILIVILMKYHFSLLLSMFIALCIWALLTWLVHGATLDFYR